MDICPCDGDGDQTFTTGFIPKSHFANALQIVRFRVLGNVCVLTRRLKPYG